MNAAKSPPLQAEGLAARLLATADCGRREELLRRARLAVRALPAERTGRVRTPPMQVALDLLRQAHRGGGHGLVWQGRPEWLSEDLLRSLRGESRDRRQGAHRLAPPGPHHWRASGPVGQAMAVSPVVRDFVRDRVQLQLGATRSNYNYYDAPGQCTCPHVDEVHFGLNLLVMLEHECRGPARSALWLHPADGPAVRLVLRAGQAVLFHARSTVHYRSPVGPEERVAIVSVGFSTAPIEETCQ